MFVVDICKKDNWKWQLHVGNTLKIRTMHVRSWKIKRRKKNSEFNNRNKWSHVNCILNFIRFLISFANVCRRFGWQISSVFVYIYSYHVNQVQQVFFLLSQITFILQKYIDTLHTLNALLIRSYVATFSLGFVSLIQWWERQTRPHTCECILHFESDTSSHRIASLYFSLSVSCSYKWALFIRLLCSKLVEWNHKRILWSMI